MSDKQQAPQGPPPQPIPPQPQYYPQQPMQPPIAPPRPQGSSPTPGIYDARPKKPLYKSPIFWVVIGIAGLLLLCGVGACTAALLSVDKSSLESSINKYSSIQTEGLYSQSSIDDYNQALSDAKTVDKDTGATQSDVDKANQNLIDAANGLETDKSELYSAISSAETQDTSKYEPSAVTAFNDALKKAKDVDNSDKATQAQIDDALAKLSSSSDALTASVAPAPAPEPSTPAPAPEPPKEVIAVSAQQLCKDYSDNEIAANKKYEGNTLKVTGVVNRVESGLFGGTLYIKGDEYGITDVSCSGIDSNALANVKAGQSITIQGTMGLFDGGNAFGVTLSGCSIVK